MAKDVRCEVNSCTYWSQGNSCNADSIYVVSQGGSAATSDDTDCKTFKRK
ncbi:MAG: DUF1540 domain-containing protein [Bacillota bacterium]